MKIHIKNILIVDGTKKKAYKGEIFIKGNKIVKISNNKPLICSPDLVIDGKGQIAAPGFVDTHCHSDLMVFNDNKLEAKLRQGITTEIIGQDGIGPAPLPIKYIEEWKKILGPIDGETDNFNWNYRTTAGYLEAIRNRGTSVNMLYLVPHGNIRLEIMGLKSRKATDEELDKMCDVLERELQNGGIGLSTGLIYPPCCFADERELIALCKVVKKYNGNLVVHQRSEGNDIINSMTEIINIGVKSGVNIHFSHFKICGKNNEHKLPELFSLLDKAKEKGVKVSFDQYPYVAGSTKLSAILPSWVFDGGTDKMINSLKDDVIRDKVKDEILQTNCNWDNFIEFSGFEGIYINNVKTGENKDLIGKNLIEISDMLHKEPSDCAFDLIIEEEDQVEMIDFYGTEEVLKKIMLRDEQNFCTDALLSDNPHPRGYGSFPRVLKKFVKEESLFTLEEAIYKMTLKPKEVFNIEKRGILREGYYADIILFDLENIGDKADFINNKLFSEGISTCIINGEIAIKDYELQDNLCGRV